MDNGEKTRTLLEEIKMIAAKEADAEGLQRLSDPEWKKSIDALRAGKEAKWRPIEEAIARSQVGSSTSGYKDWASGAPTTQEQSKAFYERLAKEAAKDDVVRDIDLNKYRTQNALDESRLARGASQFKTLADSETKLARKEALKRMLGMAGKGLSVAGKIAAPIGAIMGLYGDDIAPEGEEFEMPRKLRK